MTEPFTRTFPQDMADFTSFRERAVLSAIYLSRRSEVNPSFQKNDFLRD